MRDQLVSHHLKDLEWVCVGVKFICEIAKWLFKEFMLLNTLNRKIEKF